MKQFFYTLITFVVFASCATTKIDYLARSNDDKSLFDAVKALSKHPDDSLAKKALPVLYPLAQQRHLDKITAYNNDNNISRWDKIIEEYSILQKMYDAITNEPASRNLVSPVNYQTNITDSRQSAAENYYADASAFLDAPGRDNAKSAWIYFKKADKIVPGYKDSKAKIEQAYNNGIINVVIYPIQDNSFFFNSSWGSNSGYNYSNEYFQRNLVQDLGGTSARRYPAKFYTEREARRENIRPDWVIDLTLRNLDIPTPSGSTYSRNTSQQIEAGKDSSGKTIYETVYARVNITRQSFTARGQIEVEITEFGTRKNISSRSYSEDYKWQAEYADYTGDSRALSGTDLQLVNNSRLSNDPNKDEVLSELYRRIYPQVRSNIIYAVDW